MYYLKSVEDVAGEFKVDIHEGLDWQESEQRLKQYGTNDIPQKNKDTIWRMLLSQFKDFMVIVLMIAGIVSAFMGHLEDSLTIMVIVALNGLLGFIQEYRAEKSLEMLIELSALKARVLRSGSINEIPAINIVPGDILILQTGDKVAADGRLFFSQGLEVDEALITGESIPARKIFSALSAKTVSFGDQTNMVFSGSFVTKGQGRAIVTTTGVNTKVGSIANLLQNSKSMTTPLQKKLNQLGKWLVIVCLLCCLFITVMGVFKGESFYRMIMSGISLAVAAIPEGLPAIVTLSLALGVQRMIKRNAIIRKLPAVETLGCATVICADKTGTLTTNKMVVDQIYAQGAIWYPYQFKAAELKEFWETATICNEALLSFQKGNITYSGDPTDGALLLAAYQVGMRKERLIEKYKSVKVNPFTSEKKHMNVVCQNIDSQIVYIKGAPEVILPLCQGLSSTEKNQIEETIKRLAEKGLRILVLAKEDRNVSLVKRYESEGQYGFLGVAALKDPPRPEVKEAVKKCRKAGIKIMMITGDHKNTAIAIGQEVGILAGGKVWEGIDLAQKSEEELINGLPDVEIVARVNPGDKLRIIKALQKMAEIVAMTGDGVNDAPAIKEANIGIAMGLKGSEVAKEAASLILADDNFSTIVAAVEEGRIIYDNIRKSLRYLLTCNLGELFTILVGIMCGLPLPLLPIQMLWVNLVTDGLPALALGVETNNEKTVMEKKPRHPKDSIFSEGLTLKIAIQGSLIGLITILTYLFAIKIGPLAKARSIAFTTLVISQLFFVFSCADESKPFGKSKIFKNIYIASSVGISLLMHIIILYWSPMQKIFMTQPLDLLSWLLILCISTLPIFFWELGKEINRNTKKLFAKSTKKA